MKSKLTSKIRSQKSKKDFMTKLFGKVIIPLSYYIKGDFRFRYFDEYKKNLNKTRKEIQEFQLARLKALVHHAYDTVPYYRKLFNENNIRSEDIQTVDDLKKIPVLNKKLLMKNLEGLKSTKKYKLIKSFSGGSTGNKSVIYKDKRYHEMCSGVWMRDLYSVGIIPGHKCVWVWGDTQKNLSLKRKLVDWLSLKINRRLLFNVFNYTDEEMTDWLRNSFNKFKPDYIYGYAGIIYDLAKCIQKNKIRIVPIKKIITTSERLEHRKFIENVFNCQVIDQYGASEVNSVAIEDKNYIMHSSDDFVVVEIGKNNEVLLTPLESYGMPLLRYELGDTGLIRKKTQNDSSSPFNEFSIVIGRIYEVMLGKNKQKISGGLIKQEVEDENLDIDEFQVVQKSFEEVIINVVKTEAVSEKSVKRLKDIVKKILGASNIKVNYVKSFPTEPNGKRIAFKCEIKGDVR